MSNRKKIKPNRSAQRSEEALVASLLTVGAKPLSPAEVARLDQQIAGSRDLFQRTAARLDRFTFTQQKASPRIAALVLCAWERRAVKACPHFRVAMQSGQPVFVLLTARAAVCIACSRSVVDTDDGRCDLCDQPAPGGRFKEFMLGLANVTVHANVGKCCEGELA